LKFVFSDSPSIFEGEVKTELISGLIHYLPWIIYVFMMCRKICWWWIREINSWIFMIIIVNCYINKVWTIYTIS